MQLDGENEMDSEGQLKWVNGIHMSASLTEDIQTDYEHTQHHLHILTVNPITRLLKLIKCKRKKKREEVSIDHNSFDPERPKNEEEILELISDAWENTES